MSLSRIIIRRFDKAGFRWILSLIFTLVSYYKTKTLNKFKYYRIDKKWGQYHKDFCYYIDVKPNWNLSLSSLERNVNSLNFIQYQPKEGDTIIDVGAGVGTETIIYSMKIGAGKVYAIEAHPETFRTLELLKEVNNIENIILSNNAISSEKGVLYIDNRENHVENSIWRDKINGVPVIAITLDEYVNTNHIFKIDFLKMNIEGAEMGAIKGMTESIKIIDYIAISCHDFLFENNKTEIRDAVIDFLNKNSFSIIFNRTGHIVKDSWIYGKKIKES